MTAWACGPCASEFLRFDHTSDFSFSLSLSLPSPQQEKLQQLTQQLAQTTSDYETALHEKEVEVEEWRQRADMAESRNRSTGDRYTYAHIWTHRYRHTPIRTCTYRNCTQRKHFHVPTLANAHLVALFFSDSLPDLSVVWINYSTKWLSCTLLLHKRMRRSQMSLSTGMNFCEKFVFARVTLWDSIFCVLTVLTHQSPFSGLLYL